MRKLLLLFSLVALASIGKLGAQETTVMFTSVPMPSDGWKYVNCYETNETYTAMQGGLVLKNNGSVEFPEFENLKSLKFEFKGIAFSVDKYVDGEWKEMQFWQGVLSSFNTYVVNLPKNTDGLKLRIHVDNGGNKVLKSVTYVAGADARLDPEMKFVLNGTQVIAPVDVYLGADYYMLPSLSKTTPMAATYTSSNTEVATVSASGEVTVAGVGTTVITASCEADDTYGEGTASYTLVVNPPKEKLAANLVWKVDGVSVNDKDVTRVFGELPYNLPTLTKDTNATATIKSSNTSVAGLNAATGALRIVGVGEAKITATTEANEDYLAGTAAFTLLVTEDSAVIGVEADLENVKVINGSIEAPADAVIYNAAGARVDGRNVVTGVYVVRLANGNCVKVLVK